MKVGYVSELEDNLIALQNELQKLTEVRNDVMRKVMVAEQHQMMKRKAQVQGWFSRVEAVEAEVGELQEVKSQEIEKLSWRLLFQKLQVQLQIWQRSGKKAASSHQFKR